MIKREFLKFLLVGTIATLAHYFILYFSVHFLHTSYIALPNILASTIGISIAFVGNRYFTFNSKGDVAKEILSFLPLYLSAATIHTLSIFAMADVLGFRLNTAFILATLIQLVFTFLGNKYLVFTADAI